jgi:polyferredoxin
VEPQRRNIVKSSRLRLLSQIVFFTISMAILGFVIIAGKKAIHTICPYAIVCFGLSGGSILNFTLSAFFLGIVLGLLFLIASMWWGRFFCAWVCPLGSVQEAIFALRSKKYRSRHRISYFYENKFSKAKYVILILTIVLVLVGASYVYIQYCPFFALAQLPHLAWGGILFLLGILLMGLVVERFWCRYLCPYAALLNIFQALGKLFGIPRRKIHRNLERCIDCGHCMLYCPMNIDLSQDEKVESPNCIMCLLCTEKCPKSGTIDCQKDCS